MGLEGQVGYPSDVAEEEWAFVQPHLLLCREGSPQRKNDLRTVFNAVRSEAHTGGQWRFLPNGDREQIAALAEQVQVGRR